ncbi:hypothetical protein bcgnr5369_10680 [Bacillus cereus]
MKKCRHCDKAIRQKNSDSFQKRLGLCKECYSLDKKWVKQGIKYSNMKKILS